MSDNEAPKLYIALNLHCLSVDASSYVSHEHSGKTERKIELIRTAWKKAMLLLAMAQEGINQYLLSLSVFLIVLIVKEN